MKPEVLLEHADFVRKLARSLVVDEHTAEDIAQQTWLAAVEYEPDSSRPLRSWLARVLRNFAQLARRSDRRRLRREQVSQSFTPAPSPDLIVEREEARRRMIDAVLKLEEPYRSAILLRFYEDMPPRAIARQLDIPVETVKTRLKRALARLREDLDREHGDRKSWCLALAPLAGLKEASSATVTGAAVASTVSTVSGGLVMAMKTKAIIVAVCTLISAFILWQVVIDDRGDSGDIPRSADMVRESMASRSDVAESEDAGETGNPPAGAEKSDKTSLTALPPNRILLVLEARDKVSGEPVTAYHARISDAADRWGKELLFEGTVRDPEGICTAVLDRGCSCRIDVRSRNHIPVRLNDVWVSSEPGRTEVRIELDPGVALSGRVVDARTNTPVPGALVAPENFDQKSIVRDGSESGPLAWTDDAGRFVLNGLEGLETKVAALHPDYAEGSVCATPGADEDVEIRLKRGFAVFGTVRSNAGEPESGIEITRWGGDTAVTACVVSGTGGEYRTWPIAPGTVNVSASEPGGAGSGMPAFSPETKVIDVVDRDVRVDFGPSENHVEWSGKLVDPTGLPTEKVSIWITPTEAYSGRVPKPRKWTSSRCDTEGRFLFRKLVPGNYRVSLQFPNDNTGYRTEQSFEGAGRHERDLVLDCGAVHGEIIDEEGILIQDRSCSVTAFNESATTSIRQGAVRDGRFCIRGVPPGVYTVLATGRDFASAHVSDVIVESGKITEGVRIRVPTAGWVEVNFIGFAREDDVSVLFWQKKGTGTGLVRSDSSDHRIGLEPGEWECRVKLMRGRTAVATLERSLRVLANETTELRVTRAEFETIASDVSVEGMITFADGRPLAGAEVTLDGKNVVANLQGDRLRRVRTNIDGSFTAEGFHAGKWPVTAYVREGEEELECVLDPLVIADDALSPCYYRAVIPGCRIHGVVKLDPSVVDMIEPYTQDYCWVEIVDRNQGRFYEAALSEVPGKKATYLFRLPFVPAGNWRMSLSAKGHESFFPQPINLSHGEEHDCGMISLRPLDGICLVQKTSDGIPTNGIFYFPAIPGQVDTRYTYISEGRYIYTDVPFGTLDVKARCEGYREKAFTVNFVPGGGIQVFSVVMEPASDR